MTSTQHSCASGEELTQAETMAFRFCFKKSKLSMIDLTAHQKAHRGISYIIQPRSNVRHAREKHDEERKLNLC